jgi:hypothetical protein
MAGWGSPPASVTRGVFQGWGDSPLVLDEDPIQGWWTSYIADLAGSGTLTLPMAAAMLAEFRGAGAMTVLLDGDIFVDGLSAKWYQRYLRNGVLSGNGSLSVSYIVKPVINFNRSGDGSLTLSLKTIQNLTWAFSGNGGLAAVIVSKLTGSASFSGAGGLASTMRIPTVSPQQYIYDAVGTVSFPIPYWCTFMDVVMCSGGAGGKRGTLFITGQGGKSGNWAASILHRGVNMPYGTTALTVTVGNGGGSGDNNPGGACQVSGTGVTTITAAGGSGTQSGLAGGSPGDYSFNGVNYGGGSGGGILSGTADPPGGGGQGGSVGNGAGSAGARGQVWIRCYQ